MAPPEITEESMMIRKEMELMREQFNNEFPSLNININVNGLPRASVRALFDALAAALREK
jgi:hypothetical protein